MELEGRERSGCVGTKQVWLRADKESDFRCMQVDEKARWSAKRENAGLQTDGKGANGGFYEGQKVKKQGEIRCF